MKVHSTLSETKTARQWARAGYLPKEGATGAEMWVNQYCQHKSVYYAPAEIEPASPDQVRAFFAPERERRNKRERIQRAYQKERKARERIQAEITPNIEQITAAAAETPQTLDRVLILDTETTGLRAGIDEILQLSIIDGNGRELYNGYFLPCAEEWKEAQAVNHISPERVQNAPRISAEIPRISEILATAHTIIGYNLPFDLAFLNYSGVLIPEPAEKIDVMQLFAPVYGEYSNTYGGYKWQKLTRAAAYYGYDWSEHGSAHNSLADCYATLFVYNAINKGT